MCILLGRCQCAAAIAYPSSYFVCLVSVLLPLCLCSVLGFVVLCVPFINLLFVSGCGHQTPFFSRAHTRTSFKNSNSSRRVPFSKAIPHKLCTLARTNTKRQTTRAQNKSYAFWCGRAIHDYLAIAFVTHSSIGVFACCSINPKCFVCAFCNRTD